MEEQLDYDAEQISVERARRIAEVLRKQSGQTPQGRMVGRFYVASDPFQHLAGLASAAMANYKDKQADEKQGSIARRQNEEFQGVLENMPQRRVLTRSVTPDVGAGAPTNVSTDGARGMPMDPSTVRAQATAIQPVEQTEVVNPTRQDMLQWAGQMYKLPMARQLATKLMADYTGQAKKVPLGHIGSLDQDTGEMTPFEPGVALEIGKLQNHANAITAALTNKDLDRASRERLGEGLRETQLAIARMRSDGRGANADLDRELKQLRIEQLKEKGEREAKGKMPTRYQDEQVNKLVDEGSSILTILGELEKTPGIYGGGGPLKRGRVMAGEFLGSAADENTRRLVEMNKMVQRLDDLPRRYEMFGATLNANEKASWASATIRPGMDEEDVKRFLNIRMGLVRSKLPAIISKLKKDGVNTEGMEQYMGDRLLMGPSSGAPAPGGVPAPNLSGAKVRKVK
jgi:hypothetical protein